MKKFIAFVLAMICSLSLAGCNTAKNSEGTDHTKDIEVTESFVGTVTNVGKDSAGYIVKVKDSSSDKLKVGDRVAVPTVHSYTAEYSVGDCLKIVFNGVVEELIAVSIANKNIPSVLAIEKVAAAE